MKSGVRPLHAIMNLLLVLILATVMGCENSSSSSATINNSDPDSNPSPSVLPSCSDLAYNYSFSGTYAFNSSTENLSVTKIQSNLPVCCGPGDPQWSVTATVGALSMSWEGEGDPMTWTRSEGVAGDIVGVWKGLTPRGDDASFIFTPEGTVRLCSNCFSNLNDSMVIDGQICGTLIDIDEPNACAEKDYDSSNQLESVSIRTEYNNQIFTFDIQSVDLLLSGNTYDIQNDNFNMEIRERDEGTIIKDCHFQNDIAQKPFTDYDITFSFEDIAAFKVSDKIQLCV